jgi:allantoicase
MHLCDARTGALYETSNGAEISVKKLERHAATTQSFIPMGKTAPAGKEAQALGEGGAYVVVAALNGEDDRPDMGTMKAWLVMSSQGVSFHAGVWREWECGCECACEREGTRLMCRPLDAHCRWAAGLRHC